MSRNTAAAENLSNAYNILYGNAFIEFSEIKYDYQAFNQEKAVLERDKFEKGLTKEAKEVIDIIINCPNELLENVDKGGLSWNKFVKFLYTKGWTDYRLRKINKEIKSFLNWRNNE